MNNNRTNKILIGIIIALTVVIVVLAVVFIVTILNIDNQSDNTTNGTTKVTSTTEETPTVEPTTEELTIAPTTAKAIGCKKGCYKLKEEKDSNIAYDGGYQLDVIKATSDRISFNFYKIQSPPANRIAQIELTDLELTNGKAHFTFDDDGWGNRGEGDIEILSDKKIRFRAEITRHDSYAMWDINAQKMTLVYCGKGELFD